MNKFPKKVKVANNIFKIVDWKPNNADARNRYGEMVAGTFTIRVNTDRPFSAVQETLIHEILHAIWWSYNIEDDKDDEERIVTVLATAWSQVYMDNPKVAKFLLGR